MEARISLRLPRQAMRQAVLAPDQSYLIGRAPDCEISLDDKRLSRYHARVTGDGKAWNIEDLDSKNGTLVNGKTISRCVMTPPVWISLGGVIGHLEEVSAETLAAEKRDACTRLETTNAMIRALDPRLGLEALLEKTLTSVLALAQLQRGFVLLTVADGHLRIAAHKSVDKQVLKDKSFEGSWGAIRLAMSKSVALAYGDASVSETLGERASIVQGEIRALVCVPLCIDDQAHGVVYGDSAQAGKQFTELDVELLNALGSQASLAVGVARVKQRLNELQAELPGDIDGRHLPEGLSRRLRALPVYTPGRQRELLTDVVSMDSLAP